MSMRGMGPNLALSLYVQYMEASGVEIIANNLASTWTGVYPAQTPNGWTKTSPDTAANHIEPGAGGIGIRFLSDGTMVMATQALVVTVGRTYAYRVVVPAIVGTLVLAGTGNYQIINAPGIYTGTFVADLGTINLKRGGGALDATVTMLSIQEVIQKSPDSSEYQANETYICSNRGGAQESLVLTKLETVDAHTGAVATVVDFSPSPGAPAVITLPTGWAYACATANRTTQTSASTLVTGIAANAAPWKNAGGGTGLHVEKKTTQQVRNSDISTWALADVTRSMVTDPSGAAGAARIADASANLGYALGSSTGVSIGPFYTTSGWLANGSGSDPISVAMFASNVAANIGVTEPFSTWRRVDASLAAYAVGGNFTVLPAYAVAAFTGQADFFAPQLEPGKYPTSFFPNTLGVQADRAAATLTAPQDVCNSHSGKWPKLTVTPAFAYNETLLDATIFDDSRGHCFFEQSSQKIVFEVRGRGRIASLACTFSREQSITVTAGFNEQSLLMTLIVTGCTTGNGIYQTIAAPKRAVTVGDGYTAATFPTQRYPSGVNLAATNKWFKTGQSIQPFGSNGTFFVPFTPTILSLADINIHPLVTSGNAALYSQGILINQYGPHLYAYIASGTPYTALNAITATTRDIAVVIRNGTPEAYVNGLPVSWGTIGVSNPWAASLPLCILNENLAAWTKCEGNCAAPIYVSPLALTPTQIRNLHEQSLALLSV